MYHISLNVIKLLYLTEICNLLSKNTKAERCSLPNTEFTVLHFGTPGTDCKAHCKILVGTANRPRNGGSRHDDLKSNLHPKILHHRGRRKTTFLTKKLVFFKMRPASLTKKIIFFIIKPNKCTNFTDLFWHETLHVSESSSVNHQEFIHCTLSNGIYHTGL